MAGDRRVPALAKATMIQEGDEILWRDKKATVEEKDDEIVKLRGGEDHFKCALLGRDQFDHDVNRGEVEKVPQ